MNNDSMVCLATAHAGKFYDAVKRVIDPLPPLPPALAAVQSLPMRKTDVPNSLKACQVRFMLVPFAVLFPVPTPLLDVSSQQSTSQCCRVHQYCA